MPNKLTDIQVDEISGVDKAANKRRFLLAKREGGDDGQMPDNDGVPEEGQDTKKGGSFIGRIAEGLRSMFKADGKTFAESLAERQVDEKFWLAFDALRNAVRTVLEDADLTGKEKTEQVAVSLGQFQEFVMGLVTAGGLGKVDAGFANLLVSQGDFGADVSKAGAKIARARLEKLRAAHAVLAEILTEVEPEEAEGVNKEDVAKVVGEALKPVVERLEKIEKAGEPSPADKADQAKPEDLDAVVKEAVNKALEPVLKRLEVVEKAKGVRKSVEGQDQSDEVKKSLWAGVL